MTKHELLIMALVKIDTNEKFTEAVVLLSDETRLCFCHGVDERWAKAVGPHGHPQRGGTAAVLVNAITYFRLNAKHLDVQFDDDSRWEHPFGREKT